MEFYGSDIGLHHVPASSGLAGSTRRMVLFVSIMLVITQRRLFSFFLILRCRYLTCISDVMSFRIVSSSNLGLEPPK